jgi:hypothetical protein
MTFLEKVLNAKTDEELEELVSFEIAKLNEENNEDKALGFVFANRLCKPYNGFIGKNSRIKFSNLSMVTYAIKNDDYLYEFTKLFKKAGLKNKGQLVFFLNKYLDYYFGNKNSNDLRDDYFYKKLAITETDDEYFDMIDSFDLSDFKKKGIAMCTERGALAQNILSLFEFDSYYCMGYFNYDDKTEGHCYNIVRTVNGYRLVDFSVGVLQYSDSFERSVPFIADISTSEFEKFMSEDYEFTLENYEYEIIEDKSIRHNLGNRIYTNGKEPVVGKKL